MTMIAGVCGFDWIIHAFKFHIKRAVYTAENSTLDKGVEEKIKKKRLVIYFLCPTVLYI